MCDRTMKCTQGHADQRCQVAWRDQEKLQMGTRLAFGTNVLERGWWWLRNPEDVLNVALVCCSLACGSFMLLLNVWHQKLSTRLYLHHSGHSRSGKAG